MNATLYYFHDPMCSWCWGYTPTWKHVQQLLPEAVKVEYVVGGLAPDSNVPMPEALARTIQSHWKRIESELGTQFNYDFWTKCSPKRSTYPACRAVLAAKKQGKEKAMIQQIQEAYYLRAMNPSEQSTLVQLAEELGLDSNQFEQDISSTDIEHALQDQIRLAREYPVQGFPSLVLIKDGNIHSIPIDYQNPQPTLEAIKRYS